MKQAVAWVVEVDFDGEWGFVEAFRLRDDARSFAAWERKVHGLKIRVVKYVRAA